MNSSSVITLFFSFCIALLAHSSVAAVARAPMPRRITTRRKGEEEKEGLKRINTDWLADIALLCKLPVDDVRRVVNAMRSNLLASVKTKGSARIPNVCVLRLKTVKARPLQRRVMFGVEKIIPARAESKKVTSSVLKTFRDQV